MKKIIVFGIGSAWEKNKDAICSSEVEILAFLDNHPSGQEIEYKGVSYVASKPEEMLCDGLQYDYIIIASSYHQEIKRQLMETFAIPEEKIVSIYELFPKLYPILTPGYIGMKVDERNKRYNLSLVKTEEKNLHIQAKILHKFNLEKQISSIRDVEFKVYSQWGEDGIIQWLIDKLPITNKTFIEFGVEDYSEANTRYLLINNNWSGMIIDGSKQNMARVKEEDIYWRYNLKALDRFITCENINGLLKESGFDSDLGLLSIDIDGNDYWVLKKIDYYKPRILICEYNPLFGNRCAVTVPYKPDFYRTKEHYSNLYFGASLPAIRTLAKDKGYIFIGVNSNAANAFFVREDLVKYLPQSIMEDKEYPQYQYRQSRDEKGRLLYLSAEEEIDLVGEMEVVDLTDDRIIKIKDLKR